MVFGFRVALLMCLAGLVCGIPCRASYTIGLALPTFKDASQSRFRLDVERALKLFQEQIQGQLGAELKEEFGVEPPNLVFQTMECAKGDIPCAAKSAEELIKSDCVAVIGHVYSDQALAAGGIYDQNKVVMVTPTATHPEVAKVSNRVFRLTFDDAWQGAVIAAYVYKILERTKVAVVYDDDLYGSGLLESFVKQARSMGFQPMAELPVRLQDGRIEIPGPAVLFPAVAAADAVVLFTSPSTGVRLFRQVRTQHADIPIIGSDNLFWSSYAEGVNQIVQQLNQPAANVLVASPFFYELAPSKAYEFKRMYQSRYRADGKDEPHTRAHKPQSHTAPTPYPALFVDSALLITRGIMSGMANRKHSVKELREEVFTYLDSLDSPKEAVDGFTGSLYFDKEGSMRRPVLFGWLKGCIFKPAFVQLAEVSSSRRATSEKSGVTPGEVEGSISRMPNDKTKNDRPETAYPADSGKSSRTESAAATRSPIEVNGVLLGPRYVVYTGLNFYRIDNVNLLSQTFDAEFFLWFKWTEPEHLALNEDTIFFWNSFHQVDDQLVPMGRYVDGNIRYRAFRVKGAFLDTYDLRNYPFDSQVLSLRMSLFQPGTDRILLAVDEDVDFAADQFNIFPDEYEHLEPPEHTSGTLPLNASFGDPRRRTSTGWDYEYSVYQVRFGVTRNPFPYLLKMFLPLFVLIGICLAVFWVPVEHFSVRITLVMTSLLSAIVFHMSRAGALPNVGYLTLADKFFVFSYVIMSTATAANIWIEWLVRKGSEARSQALNSGARYLITAASVFTFLTLALPAIEKWYLRALVIVGLLFSVWLVYEFLRLHPAVRTRLRDLARVSRRTHRASSPKEV